MFIKVENEEIVAHDTVLNESLGITTEIPDQVLVHIPSGVYKYKFINNQLVPLDAQVLSDRVAARAVNINN